MRKRSFDRPRVLVMVPTNGHDGQMMLAGIFRYFESHARWDLQLIRSRSEFTEETVDAALRNGVDGFLISHASTDSLFARIIGTNLPIVLSGDMVHLHRPGDNVTCVGSDNASIGTAAAQYFLSRGRFRSFAYVADPLRREWSDIRLKAFRKALGTTCACAEFRNPDSQSPNRLLSGPPLQEFLKGLPKPAAVFAANDSCAIQVLEACLTASIDVPSDLSVLGVDNDELYAEHSTPPLSSIEFDFNETGYLAAAELQRLLSRRKNVRGRNVFCAAQRVVERRSTIFLPPSGALVENAVRLIRQKATVGLDAQAIAERLGVSRSLLDLRLRQVQHTTATELLRLERLNAVKRKLSRGDSSISDIFKSCGFANVRAAENLFRRVTGTSARVWRLRQAESSTQNLRQPSGPVADL